MHQGIGCIAVAQFHDLRDGKAIAQLVLNRHHRNQRGGFPQEARAGIQVEVAAHGFHVRNFAIALALKAANGTGNGRVLERRRYHAPRFDPTGQHRAADGQVVRFGSARSEEHLVGLGTERTRHYGTAFLEHGLRTLSQRMG